MSNNLIAIHGRKGSGKDLIGNIIRFLIQYNRIIKENNYSTDQTLYQEFLDWERVSDLQYEGDWEIKKFASKIKEIVCLLIGCTLEDLEDREFKEKELGEEWWYYTNTLFKNDSKELVPYIDAPDRIKNNIRWYLIKLTPRLLLQYIGTNCFRNIIHPDTWINSLMNEYVESKPAIVEEILFYEKYRHDSCIDCKKPFSGYKRQFICNECYKTHNWFPKWIITDLRFPNELKVIKDRGGICIKVNRWIDKEFDKQVVIDNWEPGKYYGIDSNNVESKLFNIDELDDYERFVTEINRNDDHESETALDHINDWDYEINNNQDIAYLIEQIKKILIKENIL